MGGDVVIVVVVVVAAVDPVDNFIVDADEGVRGNAVAFTALDSFGGDADEDEEEDDEDEDDDDVDVTETVDPVRGVVN